MTHLKEVNAQSRYKTFSIQDKNSITEKVGDQENIFNHKKRKLNSTHIDLKTPMGSIISAPMSQSNQNPRSGMNVTTKIEENSYSNSNETCSDSVKSSIKDLFNPKGNSRTDLAYIIRHRLQYCDQEMQEFHSNCVQFCQAYDEEIESLTQNLGNVQKNINMVKGSFRDKFEE